MNDFVPHNQKIKCPKCGKTKIVLSGCIESFEFCKKCKVPMIPCQMNFLDMIFSKFKV